MKNENINHSHAEYLSCHSHLQFSSQSFPIVMSRPIFINLVLAGLLLMPAFGNKHLLRGKRTKEFQDDIKFIISDRELKHKDKVSKMCLCLVLKSLHLTRIINVSSNFHLMRDYSS